MYLHYTHIYTYAIHTHTSHDTYLHHYIPRLHNKITNLLTHPHRQKKYKTTDLRRK